MAETSAGQPQTAPDQPIPAKVAAAAQTNSLGGLVIAQRGSNPIGNFFFALGCGVGLALLGLGLGWLAGVTGLRFIAWFAFLCFIGVLIAVIFGVAGLLAGFTGSYLYQGGVVHTKNGRMQVVAWTDVDELWLWRAGGNTSLRGKLLCYYVVTLDGRKVPIEATSAKLDGALGERLQQTVRELGRKVSDSGPYTGRLRP